MRFSISLSCLFGVFLVCQSAAAFAQAGSLTQADYLDISAQDSLEWHEADSLYIARGAARAVTGELTIEADLLTAHKRTNTAPASKNQTAGEFDRMTAEGKVFIRTATQKVYGDKAIYDLDSGLITVTGDHLKYITATDIVTARDSLVYDEKKKIAHARGNAIAEHEGTRIQGDLLTATFKQGAAQTLQTLQARGDVTIVTKSGEISRGEKAVYDAAKDIAILSGHVRITRGETQLSGDKAAVDFASGQSRLINSGSGRVRALIPTKSVKQKD